MRLRVGVFVLSGLLALAAGAEPAAPQSASGEVSERESPPRPGGDVAGATPGGELSELELFLSEQMLQMEILEAAMAGLIAPGPLRRAEGWSWRGHLRGGVERERYANYTPFGISASDPQEALNQLDRRIAEAEPVVAESGSAEARRLLDEAIELRNQAATLLSSDPELALLLIRLSAATVNDALRAAGAPEPPESARRKTDIEEDFFLEHWLRGERRTEGGTLLSLDHRLRTTDRYRRAALDLAAGSRATPVGWSLRPRVDAYLYEPGASDDSLNLRLDGELYRDFGTEGRLRATLGERLSYRREYGGPDDGYTTLAGFLETRYRLTDLQNTALRYTASAQRYHRAANRLFDYDAHTLEWNWERFGWGSSQSLSAAVEERDYDKPEGRDDYLEFRLADRLHWSLGEAWQFFQEATLSRRAHRETDGDNTDYGRLETRGGLETRLLPRIALQLEAGLDAVRYEADGGGLFDKQAGDFNEARYLARLRLGAWRGWELDLEAGLDRRRYRRGETGRYETWLSADFSPIADFDRRSYSAGLRKDLSRRAALFFNASRVEDAYRTYTQYDTRRDLLQAQFTLRY